MEQKNRGISRRTFLVGLGAIGATTTIGGLAGCAPASRSSQQAEVSYTPGTYRAEVMGHNAPIIVDVTFSEKCIEDVSIVEHSESKSIGDWAMDALRAEILERQSLSVDTVSGATISSMMLLSAVGETVEQAGAKLNDVMIPAETPSSDPLPDETVDVVVVGGGGPGLVAAARADESGLRVLLVEQLGILGGCNSRSRGVIAGGSKVQEEHGQTVTPDDMYAVLSGPLSAHLDPGLYDDDYVKGFSQRASENINWLYELGVEFGEPRPFVSGNPTSLTHEGLNSSRVMWSASEKLKEYLDTHAVDYRLNTRVVELINDEKTVSGVVAQAPNGTTYKINAKAVILGTGGYLANKEMVARYAPALKDNQHDVTIGSDGSGIDLAEKAGGIPALMDIVSTHAFASSFNGTSRSLQSILSKGAIVINGKGKRYGNESGYYIDFSAATMDQDEAFCVLDSNLVKTDVFQNDIGLSNIMDMYAKADTIEELADEIGVPSENLKETIDVYGACVRNGEDTEFNRPVSGLTSDFTKGPYYAARGKVENHTVYGGIMTDNSARVLKADGSVVNGLYAVGEVALFKEAGRAALTHGMDMATQAIVDVAKVLVT